MRVQIRFYSCSLRCRRAANEMPPSLLYMYFPGYLVRIARCVASIASSKQQAASSKQQSQEGGAGGHNKVGGSSVAAFVNHGLDDVLKIVTTKSLTVLSLASHRSRNQLSVCFNKPIPFPQPLGVALSFITPERSFERSRRCSHALLLRGSKQAARCVLLKSCCCCCTLQPWD